MSLDSFLDAKEQVRQATDIVDLVGDYIQLRREGRGYKGLCPWHDDSRPSLQVNPERQSFRCFVCNIGGDAFSFVMRMESIGFPEALEHLAERAGIQLKRTAANPQAADDKRLLFQAMAWAEEQFHHCLLNDPAAEPARKYLLDRGVTAESMRTFRLGFSPNQWDWILKRAQGTRFSPKVLETIGLVLKRNGAEGHYDRFRGRVLFSIRDPQSRPVAFGGRVLPDAPSEAGAKYINSPETPLFTKSNLLYGLDTSRQSLSKTGAALIMEGYTDCLIARQCGFDNSLAVLGTAVNERHIRLLKRFGVERIVLVLDGDEAGRRRADQVLELFIAEHVDVRVLTLPDNLDPCDFLQSRGAEPFGALIESAPDALEYKFRSATAGLDESSGVHAAYRAAEQVLAALAAAPRLATADSAVRMKEDQILNRLSRRCDIAEARLRARLTDLRRSARKSRPKLAEPAPPQQPAVDLTLEPWERELIEALLQSAEDVAWCSQHIAIGDLVSPAAKRIYGKLCDLSNRGLQPTFGTLLLEIDEELKGLIVELDESGQSKRCDNVRAWLESLLATIRGRQELAMRQSALAALRERSTDASQENLELLRRIIEGERSRQGISAPTDG